MLLVYTHETRLKTGYIVTEDLIAPQGGRYKPAPAQHPEAARAQQVMRAMSDYFCSTTRTQRIPLRDAFQEACRLDPAIAEFAKYLPATSAVSDRILIRGA